MYAVVMQVGNQRASNKLFIILWLVSSLPGIHFSETNFQGISQYMDYLYRAVL